MQRWIQLFRAGVLCGFVVMTTMPASGDALIDPFGPEAAGLSDSARESLKQSTRKVLEDGTAGAMADWKDAADQRSGRATLMRTFERDGMPCGEVEHVFTDDQSTRYTAPFCRTADGTWKFAF